MIRIVICHQDTFDASSSAFHHRVIHHRSVRLANGNHSNQSQPISREPPFWFILARLLEDSVPLIPTLDIKVVALGEQVTVKIDAGYGYRMLTNGVT